MEAARAMNALSGVKQAPASTPQAYDPGRRPGCGKSFGLFPVRVGLFVEHEKLAFDEFEVELQGTRLKVKMSGSPILSLSKSIKAVTYHNLQIRKTEFGFQVDIVFDV